MAYHFDGVDDQITFGSDASIDGFTTYSVFMWINPDSHAASAQLAGKGRAAFAWAVNLNTANRMSFLVQFSTTNANWSQTTGTATDGVPSHFGVTYDNTSSANDPLFYANAADGGFSEAINPVGTASSDAARSLFIGRNDNNSIPFDGSIGWFVYYNGIMTPAQINRCYWWGCPGGAVAIYQPLLTDAINRGTATANGTVTGAVIDNAVIPRVERNWGAVMGCGR